MPAPYPETTGKSHPLSYGQLTSTCTMARPPLFAGQPWAFVTKYPSLLPSLS